MRTKIGEIPEEWRVKRVGDLCKFITSGGTPSRHNAEYWISGDILWLKTQELCDGNIYDTEEKINANGLKNSSARIMPVNTVSMAMYGATVGKLGIFKKGMSTNQACCNMVVDENKAEYRFVYYSLLKNRVGLTNLASGAAQQNLNQDIIKNYELLVPSLNEQRAISKILTGLDEKIELNHQMNKTLEAMGQALFKRWFVDYEFPEHEKTKIDNGIPEGWRKGSLIEISDLVMGQSPPGETYNEFGDGIVFYQGNRDFGFRFPVPRVFCTAPTRIAEALDVLISVRAPVGAINITLEKCAIGRGVAALRMKRCSNGFLLYFLSTRKDLWDRFNSEGTVFGCLNKTEFQKVDLVIPTDMVMEQFDMVIKPIEAMIRKNEIENRLLVEIRDSLLPKLMSGKMRVN